MPVMPVNKEYECKSRISPKPEINNAEESSVLELIQGQSVQMEEICQKTNLDIPKISAILLSLQMKRLVRQLPGKQFIRSRPDGREVSSPINRVAHVDKELNER